LHVRLAVDGGRVRALVCAESSETLALLERHLPELRESLAAQGLGVDEVELELLPAGEAPDLATRPDRSAARALRRLERLFSARLGVDFYA
jgi:hypothetical protein